MHTITTTTLEIINCHIGNTVTSTPFTSDDRAPSRETPKFVPPDFSQGANTSGFPGSLHEFFSTGNPGILLEFCRVSWKFHGAIAFVAIDMMQRRILMQCHGKNRIVV